MKKMKRLLFIWLWIIPAVVLFCSCSEDNLPGSDISGKEVLLSIKSVSVYSNTENGGKGTFREFANGDTIGIFLADYYQGYPVFYATRENYWWYLSEQIVMRKDPIRLLAFYPYRQNEHSFLPENRIEIEHISQTDYMYGYAAYEYVSWEQPHTEIMMNHMLALIQFKFIRNEYPDDCSVQRISIKNADGIQHLRSRGRLDLDTGAIEPLDGYYEPATILPENMNFMDISSTEDEYGRILVIPTQATEKEGDLLFEFEIDGRIYTWFLKAGTMWRSGMKYTYEVEMIPLVRSMKSSGSSKDILVELTQISERK